MDDNGATFPMGYVKGLTVYFDALKSLHNFPTKIGKDGLYLEHTEIKNLNEFPTLVDGEVSLICTKIENLKELEKTVLNSGLYLTNCINLTSLEGCPNITKSSILNLKNCSNLNTLYGLKQANLIKIDGTKIPKVEHDFFISKSSAGRIELNLKTYWHDLYWYVVENQRYEESYQISWPEEFLKTLPEEYQNLYRSKSAISKYSL